MSNYRNQQIEQYSEMFGALSSPNRLKMYLKLVDCCSTDNVCSADTSMGTCVSDLSKGLDLAPSTVSHHLKELRRTGLISMNRKGQKVECSINEKAAKQLTNIIIKH